MKYTISFKTISGAYDQIDVVAPSLLDAIKIIEAKGAMKILSIDLEVVPQVCYNDDIEINN